jgi:outer membrane protein OmpA-like peptidoglycan-associated protein
VSTAIAAFGCSPSKPPEDGPDTDLSVKPPTATATTTASAAPRDPGKRTSFDDMMKTAPPLTVSADAPPTDRKQLEEQATQFAPMYERLERIWEQAPFDCNPTKKECEATWERTASLLDELYPSMQGPLCGWHNQTNAFIARQQAHTAFLQEAINTLRASLKAFATEQGATRNFFAPPADKPHLGPCLSCVAPPPRIETKISFEEGSSQLTDAEIVNLGAVKTILAGVKSATFEVRGHADPKEPGDRAALADARAKAVAGWLTKNGIPATQARAVSVVDRLPIATSATPQGRATNRRVDFERV